MTWLEDPPPWLRPAYCLIVWPEKQNVTTSDHLCNQDHILFPLLPDERDFTYNLRKRNHNRLVTTKQGRLCSCNFITRVLFKACYWLCSTSFHSRHFPLIYMYYCVIVAFCQNVGLINEHALLCYSLLLCLYCANRIQIFFAVWLLCLAKLIPTANIILLCFFYAQSHWHILHDLLICNCRLYYRLRIFGPPCINIQASSIIIHHRHH